MGVPVGCGRRGLSVRQFLQFFTLLWCAQGRCGASGIGRAQQLDGFYSSLQGVFGERPVLDQWSMQRSQRHHRSCRERAAWHVVGASGRDRQRCSSHGRCAGESARVAPVGPRRSGRIGAALPVSGWADRVAGWRSASGRSRVIHGLVERGTSACARRAVPAEVSMNGFDRVMFHGASPPVRHPSKNAKRALGPVGAFG